MSDRSHLTLLTKPKPIGDEAAALVGDLRGALERLQQAGVWDRANYSQPITEALDRVETILPLRLSQNVHEAQGDLEMAAGLLKVLFRQFWMDNKERVKWNLPQRPQEPDWTPQAEADRAVFERFRDWYDRVEDEGMFWCNDEVVS